MRVEEIDQLGEVGERARQAVDLVDDDHVNSPCPNIVEQPPERRPFHRAAGIAAIVVPGADQLPALMGLALDISFRRLPLVVERVELLLKAMLGGNAGVDGAAESWLGSLGSHGEAASGLNP